MTPGDTNANLPPVEPFASSAEDRIDRIGEKSLHTLIRGWLGDVCPDSPRGIGDDAAVLPSAAPGNLLLTNDCVVWNRHFDFSAEPEAVGAKLLKRNLSDIAATGGRPGHSVVAIACGGNLSLGWLERFYRGMAGAARDFGCEINGGDLTAADEGTFIASMTMTGTTDQPLLRRGGEDQSWIWVTGSLGGSILGQHLNFTPRLEEGSWLSGHPAVLAAMDVTDGLAADLPCMIPDGLQARIDLSFVPVSDAARASAQDTGKPAIWHAFADGEDYELVFITRPTVDPTRFEREWRERFAHTPLSPIGNLRLIPLPLVEDLPKVTGLDGEPLFPQDGFNHFG